MTLSTLILESVQTLIVVIAFVWMFKTCYKELKSSFLALSISWVTYEVVDLTRIVVTFNIGKRVPYEVHHAFWLVGTILFAIYMLIMFRLKVFEIYLDPRNQTVSDFQSAIWRLRCVKIAFVIFFLFFMIFEATVRLGQ